MECYCVLPAQIAMLKVQYDICCTLVSQLECRYLVYLYVLSMREAH